MIHTLNTLTLVAYTVFVIMRLYKPRKWLNYAILFGCFIFFVCDVALGNPWSAVFDFTALTFFHLTRNAE